MMDPQFAVNACYLPYEEGAARMSKASIAYSSQLNGAGPNAWRRHWLFLPLRDRDDSVVGVVWVDDPTDRMLLDPRSLQGLRLFPNQGDRATGRRALARH
jgi:hypothetical protein